MFKSNGSAVHFQTRGRADGLRPEAEFILAASSRQADRAWLDRCLRAPIDWAIVEEQSERGGVLPLVYGNLQEQRSVPREVLRRIERRVGPMIARSLTMTAELCSVIEELGAADVAAIPFKGPVLAVMAYGRLSLRTFSDLDILVRRRDLMKAREVLVRRGYRAEFDLTRHGEAAYLGAEHALPLYNDELGCGIDLHWRLAESHVLRSVDTDELFRRRITVSVCGRSVPAFEPEDQFLCLCIHGAKHRWSRLEWVCSLAEFIRSNSGLDWDRIAGRARVTGAVRALHVSVLLAHRYYGAPLPRKVRDCALEDLTAVKLTEDVVSAIFGLDQAASGWSGSRWRGLIFLLRVCDGPVDRGRILLRTLFRIPHPQAPELIVLPAAARWLYYFLRPLRLIAQAFRDAHRSVSRR